jgi:hypothetical protein
MTLCAQFSSFLRIGGTLVFRGTPVEKHCRMKMSEGILKSYWAQDVSFQRATKLLFAWSSSIL